MSAPLLVFGRSGQVARELAKLGAADGVQMVCAGREMVDLSRDDGGALVRRLRPWAVINAAAYTAVDRAQSEPEAAYRLNRDAAGEIARGCAAVEVPLVHISTDYVFDGTKPTPYVEADPRRPLGVYGASKAQGEQAVQDAGGAAAIARTSWVYSAYGANFIKTMLRLARERDEVAVVADQQGRPTWAQDVARGTLLLATRLRDGDADAEDLFHLAGEGDATWADFAEAIFAESARRNGPSARVRRITTAEHPTPAARPANSRLDGDRLLAVTGWRPGPWRRALSACLDEMETQTA